MRDRLLEAPSPSTKPAGALSGSTRQWYSSGKPAYSFVSTQPVVRMCAASSRQAPNPAEPTPYW